MSEHDIQTTIDNIESVLELSESKGPLNVKSNTKNKLSTLRWLILIFTCLSSIGNYYCYDIPQSLQSALMEKLNLTLFQYNIFYIVFSFPNIIIPVLGGLAINKIGLMNAFRIFCSLLVIGQGIMTIGASRLDYGTMLAGQAIYALGGDCVLVCQTAIISKWFRGRNLSFALGLSLCISRLGSGIESFTSNNIYDATGELAIPYLVGLGAVFLSWLACLGLEYLDRKAEKVETKLSDYEAPKNLNFTNTKGFSLIFYLLIINSGLLYMSFFGLTNNINHFMVQRFGFTPISAGNFVTIIYICPILASAVLGKLVDEYGKRVLMIFVASLIFLLAHVLLAFLPDADNNTTDYAIVWILLWIGFFFAIYTSVFWPCIALVVQENMTALGYGIAYAVQNLLVVIITLILGSFHDEASEIEGYFWTEIVLSGLVGFCIILIAWIFFEDKRTGGRLTKSKAKLEKHGLTAPLPKRVFAVEMGTMGI